MVNQQNKHFGLLLFIKIRFRFCIYGDVIVVVVVVVLLFFHKNLFLSVHCDQGLCYVYAENTNFLFVCNAFKFHFVTFIYDVNIFEQHRCKHGYWPR